ncbi:hypothetical protein E1B28_008293 [Marasmius oreades]|uniref:Uncharacterized protein n=1 Tax=Marasmius oreades TaxID=181124 RepID=A0A9P7URL5_9AGAR|nr:uncharacterized protein E1B28_008293 [Marasmius oreades]KAG7091892.1 hypothetical protein E1B28_008293 [Marasmius oreades]
MDYVAKIADKDVQDFKKDDAEGLLSMYLILVELKFIPDINEPGDYERLQEIDDKLVSPMGTKIPAASPVILLALPSSHRLRCTLDTVQFYGVENRVQSSSQYSFNIHEEAFRNTVDLLLSESPPAKPYTQQDKQTIVNALLQEFEVGTNTITRFNVSIHAEITLLIYIHSEQLVTYPYLGVSKLSCSSCVELIKLLNETLPTFYTTSGARGRFYPSWGFPPNLPSSIKFNMVNVLQGLLLANFATLICSRNRAEVGADSSIDSQGASAHTGDIRSQPKFDPKCVRSLYFHRN